MRLCSSRLLQQVFAGAMLFLCLLVLMSTALVGCGQPTPAPKLNAFQSWITQHAVPLKTVDPQGPLDDLQPLRQIVSNASIVGLGEATHGSHEFFTMKHRLLEFLVEKMGFTMFAMEGSWSAGEQINTYVLTGQGDAANVLGQFHLWTWNTQEVLALVKWVRAYDADPSHVHKVRFAGFDCQFIETITFDHVTQYLQTVDPQSASRVTSLYQGLPQYLASNAQVSSSTQQQYLARAQQVYDLLKQHEKQYEARSSLQAFAQALQEARVVVQGVQFLSYNLQDPQSRGQAAQQRDAFMAENIAWLHAQADGGSKLVVWAHDGHIQRDQFMAENSAGLHTQADGGSKLALWAHDGHIQTVAQSGYTSMGMYLRERYQSQYLAIGTSFYQGSFNAHGLDKSGQFTPLQSFTIQAPATDSYNYTLGGVNIPLYLLDLRTAASGPVSQWLDEPHGFLMIGAIYSDKYQSAYYTPLSLRKSFDVIIHIQKVTASQLIPLEE